MIAIYIATVKLELLLWHSLLNTESTMMWPTMKKHFPTTVWDFWYVFENSYESVEKKKKILPEN